MKALIIVGIILVACWLFVIIRNTIKYGRRAAEDNRRIYEREITKP